MPRPAALARPPESRERCGAPDASASERLRQLARRVRRLGVSGRTDPESVLVEKDEIAHRLNGIARELDGGSGR
jgi:hypothetical protein